jgi:hypothetical protein
MAEAATAMPVPVPRAQVDLAARALVAHVRSRPAPKQDLLETTEPVLLNVTVKSIPTNVPKRPYLLYALRHHDRAHAQRERETDRHARTLPSVPSLTHAHHVGQDDAARAAGGRRRSVPDHERPAA